MIKKNSKRITKVPIVKTEQWITKYEPKTVDEMILDPKIRKVLSKALVQFPNIMLIGNPGVGKSTFKKIFKKLETVDVMEVNCSEETGVEVVRTKIKAFATALGFSNRMKYVILEECDFLSEEAQAAFRGLIDFVQDITRFMFLCNDGSKMIEPIKSRCQVVNINEPPVEEIGNFINKIIESEKIKVENKLDLVELIDKSYPDIRKMIVLLQQKVVRKKLPHSMFSSQ